MSALWMGALAGSAGTIVAAWLLWWVALRCLPTVFHFIEIVGDRIRRR